MRGILCRTLSDIDNIIMLQSIPAAPSAPPPPRLTPEHWHFFCLGSQIPGGGDSLAVESPRIEMKKEGKCLSSINTATFFIDRTVEWCYFKHFFWGGAQLELTDA